MIYYSWICAIPLWFYLFINGQHSIVAPDIFRADTTISGRIMCSSNSVNYYNFDTLVNTGWKLVLEPMSIDSFPIQTYTIGQ